MNIRRGYAFLLPVIFMVLASLSGCIATSSEMSYLRDDIAQLQMKLTEVQRNQADLSTKMDSVSTSMDSLTAELQQTQNSMSLMSQRLDDVESNITQRVSKFSDQLSGSPSSIAPAPSEMYRAAYSDFSRGKYDLAITGFRSYIERNPKGELAAQAQYYLGECYYSTNEWEKALAEFELVEQYFPSSNSVPSARLKQALCMEQLDKIRDASDVLNALVKDYPASPEAFTAREKLKAYHRSDGK